MDSMEDQIALLNARVEALEKAFARAMEAHYGLGWKADIEEQLADAYDLSIQLEELDGDDS